MANPYKTKHRAFWLVLFIVYSGAMLWLLFDRPSSWANGTSYAQLLAQNINMLPLLTIRNYWSVVQAGMDANPELFRHCVINLVGNVALFVPAGILLPKLFPSLRKLPVYFFSCAGIIFLIESVQLYTLRGSFDVDDVILNLLGMTIGFALYQLGGLFRRS